METRDTVRSLAESTGWKLERAGQRSDRFTHGPERLTVDYNRKGFVVGAKLVSHGYEVKPDTPIPGWVRRTLAHPMT